MKTVYLAGGCFWGVQKFLDQFDGIIETEVGYANGPEGTDPYAADGSGAGKTPSYEDVCSNSGHAETVKVVFDEQVMPLDDLLERYFMVIDPLSVNRQGHDTGIQYRTGIYYINEEMLPVIDAHCSKVAAEAGSPLAVEVQPLVNYYPAEEYHQKYLDKNPHGYCHIPRHMLALGQR